MADITELIKEFTELYKSEESNQHLPEGAGTLYFYIPDCSDDTTSM